MKFINEDIEDVLKPKSKNEIDTILSKNLEDILNHNSNEEIIKALFNEFNKNTAGIRGDTIISLAFDIINKVDPNEFKKIIRDIYTKNIQKEIEFGGHEYGHGYFSHKRYQLVNENLEDILKPKQLIGKIFYDDSSFSPVPLFVFMISKIKSIKSSYSAFNYPINIMEFECIVLFNKHLIEGPNYYELNVGETFRIDQEQFHFKELDRKPIEKMDKQIRELEADKKYIEKLLNEK